MISLTSKLIDRIRGSLIGLAVGDALGMPVEFRPPGSFDEVTDMQSGGSFDLDAGQWTDDTSMALCLAESLIEKNGFDPVDQLERYLKWHREGYLSVNGECFDIGNTIVDALVRFEETHQPTAVRTTNALLVMAQLCAWHPSPYFIIPNLKRQLYMLV